MIVNSFPASLIFSFEFLQALIRVSNNEKLIVKVKLALVIGHALPLKSFIVA